MIETEKSDYINWEVETTRAEIAQEDKASVKAWKGIDNGVIFHRYPPNFVETKLAQNQESVREK